MKPTALEAIEVRPGHRWLPGKMMTLCGVRYPSSHRYPTTAPRCLVALMLVAVPQCRYSLGSPSALLCVEVTVMSSMVSAIVAVIGTLLGATATYVFQRIDADRKDRVLRIERFRQERLAVYAEFAGAVTDLRRAAYDRWHRYQEESNSPAFAAARDEYYRLYAVARNVQLKLRLLTDDTDLVRVAHEAVERATEIKDADTEPERQHRGEQAKQALDDFISAASGRLR